MSHFAKVVDGIVQDVIVAEQDFIDTLPDKDLWIQTSYNTMMGKHWAVNKMGEEEDTSKPPLRGNYATIGGVYDSVNDKFYTAKPHNSWILNTTQWLWEPPVKMPELTEEEVNAKKAYLWDEDAYQADTGDPKTQGWKLVDGGYG